MRFDCSFCLYLKTVSSSNVFEKAVYYTLNAQGNVMTTYETEFYMTNASAFCFFRVDDVLISYEDESVLTVCREVDGFYRYQFNGMEADNEVKGKGNSYTTEFRQYDPRLGRWLSIDPLFQNFPWQSPYVAFDNNPIYYNDPLGAASEVTATNLTVDDKGKDPLYRGGKFGEDELVIRPSGCIKYHL